MNTLLFIFTLSANTCIAYLPNSGDYTNAFTQYTSIQHVDVYDASALSDTLADKLFPAIYQIDVNDVNQTVQCRG